jgi:YHS domain-containing protein
MKRIAVALISVAMLSGAAFAQNTGKATPAVAKVPAKAMCPIMKHDFAVTAKTLKSDYKGKTYYFCCGGCKPAFDKEPAKFAIADKPAPKKPAPKKPAPKA